MTRFVLGFVMLAVCATRVTASGTDQDSFNKLVAKGAPSATGLLTSFKPKLACVCLNGAAGLNDVPGVVAQGAAGSVSCWLPQFDSTGKVESLEACTPFEVLH